MTPAQTQAQPVNAWDAADAECGPWERVLQEHWEQEERDAMFTAEVSGPPSLMERAAGPLLFLLAAFVAAGVIVAAGKAAGWIQ